MTTTQQTEPSALSRIVRRHPVAAFLLTALPLAFAVMSVPVMAQYGVIPGRSLPRRVGMDMEETASLLLVVTLFLTALGITRLTEGPAGVRVLVHRMTRWRVA